ncbi:hypothetical protein SJAV_19230 [Sulfurisphaera javensis]|uniref:Uncharacterized protein n=1 Tax=Sulfurisphaera javensis TaxID=2049879 RepID=A0AAT9GSU5_9CREN
MLFSYYTTSDGYVEYFKSSDPSFIIKSYVDGTLTPTLITVFVNLPHTVKFLTQSYTNSFKISFSEIKPYISPWKPWLGKVNTSLLVIATYINGNKTYF